MGKFSIYTELAWMVINSKKQFECRWAMEWGEEWKIVYSSLVCLSGLSHTKKLLVGKLFSMLHTRKLFSIWIQKKPNCMKNQSPSISDTHFSMIFAIMANWIHCIEFDAE